MRNLVLEKTPIRLRGKTIDDESLPSALQTPAKVLALRENHKLEHSRSSSQLRQTSQLQGAQDAETLTQSSSAKNRPSATKLRRRSTLNWANASPRIRQQKLEGVTAERMADIWLSLHVDGVDEPIYVSEVIEKAMNPSFRSFDLTTYGPFVTRRDEVTVNCWVKTESMNEYMRLIELHANLRSLQFIGKTVRHRADLSNPALTFT